MKKLIVGFGVSGSAAATLLRHLGHRVLAVDRKADELPPQEGIELLREDAFIDFETIDELILSPGVTLSHPLVQQALEKKIPVIGEIALAFRSLQQHRCIGITGTNGKTTTTLLVAHVLNFAKKKARALGNVGEALSAYVPQADPEEILVVELSSYQLEMLSGPCLDAAVFLNLTPDHLDRYASLEQYALAKCRIADCLKQGGQLFVSQEVAQEWGSHLHAFSTLADIPSMKYTQLGEQNICAAFALCRLFGVTKELFERALQTFQKPHHRVEYVGEWNQIRFYDDSKGTNIDAVMYAVKSLPGPIVLLAGGVDKGASYEPWIDVFRGKVERMICFGQAAPKMEAQLKGSFDLLRVATLREALLAAIQEIHGPSIVLLSPGCSSFDQYRDYKHRGNEFKAFVEEKIWIEERRS